MRPLVRVRPQQPALALEDGMKHEIKMMRRVAGMASGGLFNIRVSGPGVIAMTTHHTPITLRVQPGEPVFTDPNATVAWAGTLTPDIHIDMSLKTLFGRGSGETFQLRFQGSGWVVLQPYDEVHLLTAKTDRSSRPGSIPRRPPSFPGGLRRIPPSADAQPAPLRRMAICPAW